VRPSPRTETDTSTTRVSATAAAVRMQSAAAPPARATPRRSELPLIAGLLALPLLVRLHLAIQLLEGFRSAHPRVQPLVRADLLEEAGVRLADRHVHLDVGAVGAALAVQLLLGQPRAVERIGDHGLADLGEHSEKLGVFVEPRLLDEPLGETGDAQIEL